MQNPISITDLPSISALGSNENNIWENYLNEFEEDGETIKIYDALYVKERGTKRWMALIEIEGFDYEKGYEYMLNIKEVTQANPYSIKYVLLDILWEKAKN